jgi:hypothetical protein
MPFRSFETIASSVDSTIAASWAWAASIRRRALISRMMLTSTR